MITTTKLSGQPFWPKPSGFDLDPEFYFGLSAKKFSSTIRRIKSPNPKVYFPASHFRISPEKKEINLEGTSTFFQVGTNSKSGYSFLNFSCHWMMPWIITEIHS
jgi:hypothetical protein